MANSIINMLIIFISNVYTKLLFIPVVRGRMLLHVLGFSLNLIVTSAEWFGSFFDFGTFFLIAE